MRTHHHLKPAPRAELVDYLLYLGRDSDERPIAIKIDDNPQDDWLEEALEDDEGVLPEDKAALVSGLTGEDATGWTYAEAATHLADWCRQQLEEWG